MLVTISSTFFFLPCPVPFLLRAYCSSAQEDLKETKSRPEQAGFMRDYREAWLRIDHRNRTIDRGSDHRTLITLAIWREAV